MCDSILIGAKLLCLTFSDLAFMCILLNLYVLWVKVEHSNNIVEDYDAHGTKKNILAKNEVMQRRR